MLWKQGSLSWHMNCSVISTDFFIECDTTMIESRHELLRYQEISCPTPRCSRLAPLALCKRLNATDGAERFASRAVG